MGSRLAGELNAELVPEFARDYCSAISRKANLEDVHTVGNKQIEEFYDSLSNDRIIIFDTSLITSIIWMFDKFGVTNFNFHKEFLQQHFDLTLLCYPDVGWKADPLREDGKRQMEIHNMYINYMDQNQKKYTVVEGLGENRFDFVKKVVQSLI